MNLLDTFSSNVQDRNRKEGFFLLSLTLLDEKDEKLKGKAHSGVYSKILESSEVSDLWNENEYCQEFV